VTARGSAHVLDRRLVAPHGVEPLGDRERHADRAHEHEPLDALGVTRGEAKGHRAAEGVADDADALDPEDVEQPDRVRQPGVDGLRVALRRGRAAEAELVGRDHPVAGLDERAGMVSRQFAAAPRRVLGHAVGRGHGCTR
jgi:hypothetical protein